MYMILYLCLLCLGEAFMGLGPLYIGKERSSGVLPLISPGCSTCHGLFELALSSTHFLDPKLRQISVRASNEYPSRYVIDKYVPCY